MLLRRLVCGTMLVVFAVGMTGFALPVPKTVSKTTATTERFPCESCPCGCSTAEYCWDKCCCHSDEEKLRWAERNSVQAPQFLIDRVAALSSAADQCVSQSASCCGCRAKATTESTNESSSNNENALVASETAGNASANPTRYLQLQSVAKCRGIEMVWTLLAQLVIPPLGENASPMPRLLYRLHLIDERAASVLSWQDPPVPWIV